MSPEELDFTGERFLPEQQGSIAIEHQHRYAWACQFASGKRVLDIACGEGYGANMLASVAAQVLGVDIDAAVVAHAGQRYRRPNLQFRQASCTQTGLPSGGFDLVVSFETLEHHDQHQAMLLELRRVLAPDGLIVISTPDRMYYSDPHNYCNPYHVRELYAEEFFELLRSHFTYTCFLGQRIVYGSLLVPLYCEAGFRTFEGSLEKVSVQPGLNASVYMLAMASAVSLPAVDASLLDATQLHFKEVNKLRTQKQVAEDLLASMRGSLYWRLAEPWRWLRRCLGRMRGWQK